jgi:hypothetical protein
VGKNGFDPHTAIALQAGCHRARAWQGLVLGCWDNGVGVRGLSVADGAQLEDREPGCGGDDTHRLDTG